MLGNISDNSKYTKECANNKKCRPKEVVMQ